MNGSESIWTSFANGQRIARRSSDHGLSYSLTDTLGSTAMMPDENGAVEHELVYDPWGDSVQMWRAGGVDRDSLPRRQFTGQGNDGRGLFSYGAR